MIEVLGTDGEWSTVPKHSLQSKSERYWPMFGFPLKKEAIHVLYNDSVWVQLVNGRVLKVRANPGVMPEIGTIWLGPTRLASAQRVTVPEDPEWLKSVEQTFIYVVEHVLPNVLP